MKEVQSDFFSVASKTDKPVILYGAGERCGDALHLCENFNVQVKYICDGKKTGFFEYIDKKYEIISPQILAGEYSDSLVLISSLVYEDELKQNLKSMNFADEQIFFLSHLLEMQYANSGEKRSNSSIPGKIAKRVNDCFYGLIYKHYIRKYVIESLLNEFAQAGEFEGFDEVVVLGQLTHYKHVKKFFNKYDKNMSITFEQTTSSDRQKSKYLITSADYRKKIAEMKSSKVALDNYALLPLFNIY